MKLTKENGFSLIELLVVVFLIATVSYLAYDALSGWRERNALRNASQEIKSLMEKYRQRAIDKGYNYGLLFSDDGLYVFEDNGGTGASRFTLMNNFAINTGEFSDQWRGTGGTVRQWRRVSRSSSEIGFFIGSNAAGRLMVMTTNSLGLSGGRSGTAYSVASGYTDITSSAAPAFAGGDNAPFASGALALFFAPDGFAYLKDPTVSASMLDSYAYQLGNGVETYYVVRVAYDDTFSAVPDVPTYFEIAINRYGSATLVRWQTSDGGSTWDAEVQ